MICAAQKLKITHCFQIKYDIIFSPRFTVLVKYSFSIDRSRVILFIVTFMNRLLYLYQPYKVFDYYFFIIRRLAFIFCASLFSSLHTDDIFDGKDVQRLNAICLILLSYHDSTLSPFKASPSQAACPFSFYLTFSIRYTYTHG